MKTCKTCSEELPKTAFYTGKSTCKRCTRERALARYRDNREECIAKVRDWQLRNPERQRAYCGKRDAIRRGGRGVIPRGFKIEDTFAVYAEAIKRQKETNTPHHVDHIIPVTRGGKHCPSNLQVLTATENITKGDRL